VGHPSDPSVRHLRFHMQCMRVAAYQPACTCLSECAWFGCVLHPIESISACAQVLGSVKQQAANTAFNPTTDA
jgi:hypothetical protein